MSLQKNDNSLLYTLFYFYFFQGSSKNQCALHKKTLSLFCSKYNNTKKPTILKSIFSILISTSITTHNYKTFVWFDCKNQVPTLQSSVCFVKKLSINRRRNPQTHTHTHIQIHRSTEINQPKNVFLNQPTTTIFPTTFGANN